MITERREEFARTEVKAADDDVGIRKKLAFLDLLIEASEVNVERDIAI